MIKQNRKGIKQKCECCNATIRKDKNGRYWSCVGYGSWSEHTYTDCSILIERKLYWEKEEREHGTQQEQLRIWKLTYNKVI